MRSFIFLSALLFLSISSKATFIAGGNITMSHVSGNDYAIELDLYYDDIEAETGLLADDSTIVVAIYAKNPITGDYLMDTVRLIRTSKSFVPYAASDSNYLSALVRYRLEKYVINNSTQTVTLDPSIYNNPYGYYMVWERCCLESDIANIENPASTGAVFYTAFPSLSNGVYSSPQPSIYKTNYAVAGQPFSVSLACTNPDNDSLVYSLATPMTGHADLVYYGPEPVPPFPAPYPLVTWATGYSATNAIHGNPPLAVNPVTGMLTVTPNDTITGLFMFSVICNEYRNGVLIGQVRQQHSLWVFQDSVTSTTGITQASNLSVQIYPNPTSGIVNISSSAGSSFTYEVENAIGVTVLSGTGNSFITSSIKPGIYFVKISSGNSSSIQKLIVE